VCAVALGGATFATSAQAQDAKVGVAPAQSTAATPIAAKVEDDSPDHERFIGHFAVGYFGISQIPIATATPAPAGGGITGYSATGTNVTSPIIGIRYWLSRGIGVDAGIGIGYSNGGTTTVAGNTTTTVSNPSAFGFALHGGVPFALAEGHHYVFEFVPETTLGFASGTVKGAPGLPAGAGVGGAAATPAGPDTSVNGVRFDLGARIGAELHFGFIGVPELALQASIGVYLHYGQFSASQGNNSISTNGTTFATTVSGDPWAIFADTISALYYF
jgi:hypothetical protein